MSAIKVKRSYRCLPTCAVRCQDMDNGLIYAWVGLGWDVLGISKEPYLYESDINHKLNWIFRQQWGNVHINSPKLINLRHHGYQKYVNTVMLLIARDAFIEQIVALLPWCSSVRLSVCLRRACIVIIRCTLARISVYSWIVQCSGHPDTPERQDVQTMPRSKH